MWLCQVGAVVPGMVSVVVNQSHFLENKQNAVSTELNILSAVERVQMPLS